MNAACGTTSHISSREMENLNRSSVIWHCCKCDSMNVDSFTYNSFELYTSNAFMPLSDLDITLDSANSSTSSNTLFTSSPSVSLGRVSLQKLRVRLWPCKTGLSPPVTVLLIVPSRYFCSGSFCFMSWCLKIFCAVGALCMFSYF